MFDKLREIDPTPDDYSIPQWIDTYRKEQRRARWKFRITLIGCAVFVVVVIAWALSMSGL